MAWVVTNNGLAVFVGMLNGTIPSDIYIAWGTGTGVAGVESVVLFDEDVTAGYARVACTLSVETTDIADDTLVISGTLVAAGNLQITNWGLFDDLTAGNLIAMENRTPAISIALGASQTFTFRFKFRRPS